MVCAGTVADPTSGTVRYMYSPTTLPAVGN